MALASPSRELIGLAYSPWTEKARWALQHHRVPFRYAEHLMIFGMPWLRWKMRKPFGDVTVPALIDGSQNPILRLGDSWDIALHAEKIGSGTLLFPKEHLSELETLNRLSERILDSARALIVERTLRSPEAQWELLPPFIPPFSRRPLRFIAGVGLNYIAREFGTRIKSSDDHRLDLRELLSEMRRLRKKANGLTLLGDFSYADVVMAAALHFVSPPPSDYLKIGQATRACWTDADLARDYADLIAWRDELYRKYRKS